MTTFLHTADWQLGKPFARIADDEGRGRVQRERLDAVRRIGEAVRARDAAFVLVAGDLFDSATVKDATIAHALEAVGSLGVPVYAIPGNHDHGGPDGLWERPFFRRERERVAPDFHLLLERVPLERDDVVILPCPLLRRHEPDDPTAWLRTHDFTPHGDRPRVVLAHGSVRSFAPAADGGDGDDLPGQANAIDLDRLPAGEIDYVALGDWHGFLPLEGGALAGRACYAGTHETDRFPREGQRPGHVACVTAVRGALPRIEALATGRLRWMRVAARLGAEGVAGLDRRLRELAGERSGDCLVDLVLSGDTTLDDRSRLDTLLDDWRARVIRFDLEDDVRVVPSDDEVRALVDRPSDPILAAVAADLVGRLGAGGEDGGVAREALRILHGICREAGAVGGGDAGGAP